MDFIPNTKLLFLFFVRFEGLLLHHRRHQHHYMAVLLLEFIFTPNGISFNTHHRMNSHLHLCFGECVSVFVAKNPKWMMICADEYSINLSRIKCKSGVDCLLRFRLRFDFHYWAERLALISSLFRRTNEIKGWTMRSNSKNQLFRFRIIKLSAFFASFITLLSSFQ